MGVVKVVVKRKKIAIFFCCLIVISAIGLFAALAFLAYGKIDVYHETSPQGDIEVRIRGSTGFFEFTPRGATEYELVVSKPGLFKTTIFRKQFLFNADGAFTEKCVHVEWSENKVEVEIDNMQHEVNSIKKLVCYY